jgi:hypothetical protein
MSEPKDSKQIAEDLYDKRLNGDPEKDWPGIDRESFVQGYLARDAEIKRKEYADRAAYELKMLLDLNKKKP